MVFLPDLTKSIFADRSALPPASAKAPPAGIVLSARPAALSRRQKIFNTARFLLRPAEIHPCGAASSQQGFPLRRRFRADKKFSTRRAFFCGRQKFVRAARLLLSRGFPLRRRFRVDKKFSTQRAFFCGRQKFVRAMRLLLSRAPLAGASRRGAFFPSIIFAQQLPAPGGVLPPPQPERGLFSLFLVILILFIV